MRLDDTDVKILKIMLSNSRLSNRQIALRVGLSTPTILSRIKKMEKEKVIKLYTTILDHEMLGYELTAIIEVMVQKGKLVEVEKQISTLENVCAVYDVTGTTDAIIVAKFKSRDEMSVFVKETLSIPYVERTNTSVVFKTVKEDFRLV
ncbi:MAG: Lrp/AsnC family transcriptional regulator [Nitrosopumilaceae archaeon]